MNSSLRHRKCCCNGKACVFFNVHGSVQHESVSITVQQDTTIYSFIIFLQTALHVSDDTLINHQEHTQTVIATSGTVRTEFATFR